MSKFWRVIAPVVAAGGLVAAGAVPAASASPKVAAAYAITIGAQATYPKISGHALVIYKAKGLNTATISGTVTGNATGDIAALWSEPFGATAFTATTQTVTLTTAATASYSFAVTPSRATAYEVQVTTGSTADITSTPVTVYVSEGGKITSSHKKCTSTTCTFSYHVWEVLPAVTYNTEAHKKIYLYLAVGYPKLPGRFTLDKGAKAAKVKKVSSGEFEVTLTWYITLRHGEAAWATAFCTKDSESKDGMGLPGTHGCGDTHISRKTKYIG